MKRRNVNWGKILTVALLAVALAGVGLVYRKMEELTNQIAYLQDSTNIILSDVGGLETNIAQTLEAETSLVENYSIEIIDMDFAAGTYEVEVAVIPKEYTDSTELMVYFGTQGFALEKDGFEYIGRAKLPLGEDYSGNLTFLFADGKKKNTEVYSNFAGIQNKLENVLWGQLDGSPEYKDGVLSFLAPVDYLLDGVGRYEFDVFELVAQFAGTECYCQEISEDLAKPEEENSIWVGLGVGGEDTQADEAAPELMPVSDMEGSVNLTLETTQQKAGELRIFLQAKSVDGYRFEYELFRGNLTESSPGADASPEFSLDEESFDRTPAYVVYDRHGGRLELL